jgi:hypothetical protein
MAVMILIGLYNVDRVFYQGKMLKPVYTPILRHVLGRPSV